MKFDSKGDKVLGAVNYVVLSLAALICLLPFLNIFVSSFTSAEEIILRGFVLIPRNPTLSAYQHIFSTPVFLNSILNSVHITVMGTFVSMIFTITMAYALAQKRLIHRSFFNFLVVFTMLFSGGMIPTYILVVNLGLIDSYWALWLTGAVNAFNMILLKNFFMKVPAELSESARIDGANEFHILVRIMLPVSLPAIATFSLFYAVGYWNIFFSALLYIHDPARFPIQILLRNIVILASGGFAESDPDVVIPSETLKMAVIIVSTIPILCVYPFLQRYFTKGIMVGSLKG